jgi:hypothetical protein
MSYVASVNNRLLVIVPVTVTVSAAASPRVVLPVTDSTPVDVVPVVVKPPAVNVVPLNVKLAESTNNPAVDA